MVRVSDASCIDWLQVTHEERDEIIEYDEEITEIVELETIDQGGSRETWHDGYIESVNAWIRFSICT